ncbi:hypothetical protein V2J09_010558 [Rumex salicifolius]
MASRQNYYSSQIQYSNSIDHRFEFQESDLWNTDDDRSTLISPSSPEPHQNIPAPRSRKRSIGRKSSISGNSSYAPAISAPASLPVNIPDWSKILGAGEDQDDDVDGSDDDEFEDRVPPHVYAARQLARRSGMVVAFSVQEGVGRTLKGRDLRRVRNAIWKQTGFED